MGLVITGGGGSGGSGIVVYKTVANHTTQITPGDKTYLQQAFDKGHIVVVKNTTDGKFYRWENHSVPPAVANWQWYEFLAGVQGETGSKGDKGDPGPVGPKGDPGNGIDFTGIAEGEVIANSNTHPGTAAGSGLFLQGTDTLFTRKNIIAKRVDVDPGTFKVGSISIRDNGAFLENIPDTTGVPYLLCDYKNDLKLGSTKPNYWKRDPWEPDILRSPRAFNYNVPKQYTTIDFGQPQDSNEIDGIDFNFVQPVQDLKFMVVVNGKPIRWMPSKYAWNNALAPGYTFGAGYQKLVFEPHISFLDWYTDVSFVFNKPIQIMGANGTNLPWYTIDRKAISSSYLALEDDLDKKVDKVPGKALSTNDLTDKLVLDIQNSKKAVYGISYDPNTGQLDFKDIEDNVISSIHISTTGGGELTLEQIQQAVGAMFTNNKVSGITSTYDSVSKKIDMVVTYDTDQIESNKQELQRIREAMNQNIFSGSFSHDVTNIPFNTQAYKGYFISTYALDNPGQVITLPSHKDIANGTVFCLDNNDINDNVFVAAPAGETINSGTSRINVPKENMIFLVKDSTNWKVGFSGYIPSTLQEIIGQVRLAIPSAGQAPSGLTMTEIQAALKDRLHTFREIGDEFRDKLHTIRELQAYGFDNIAIFYGFVQHINTNPVEADGWLKGRLLIDRPMYLGPQNIGSRYMGFIVPLSIAPLVSKIKINGAQASTKQSDYVRGGLKYKLFLVQTPTDTSGAINIEFVLNRSTPGTNGNTAQDETFHYLSDFGAISLIPTKYDNLIIDYTPIDDDITQPLPSVYEYAKSGARIFVRNMSDYHSIKLQAKSYQSIEGLNEYVVEPRQNIEFIVDKSAVKYRAITDYNYDGIRPDAINYVKYGWGKSNSTPTGEDWIIGEFPAMKSFNTPPTELGDVYLFFAVPTHIAPCVKELSVDNTSVDLIQTDYTYRTQRFKLFTTGETVNMHNAHKVQISWGIEYPPHPGTAGILMDDGIANVAGVNAIDLKGMYMQTHDEDPQKVTLVNGVTFNEMDISDEGGVGGFKGYKINTMFPLQTYSDPNGDDYTGVLEIKHDYFEKAKPDGYFAVNNYEVELVGKDTQINNKKVKEGVLWFDSPRVNTEGFIEVRRDKKAIGIQEPDEADPNVTGGTATIIGARIDIKGKAKLPCYVEMFLRKTSDNTILKNVLGQPIGVKINYKKGDSFGYLQLLDIVVAKGLTDFQLVVQTTNTDPLVIKDASEGSSCIMVQYIRDKEQTGDALSAFEKYTQQNVHWSVHYMGESFAKLDYLLSVNMPIEEGVAGQGQTMEDGFHFHNATAMNMGIQDKKLIFQDNGKDMCYFNFGYIANAEETFLLRNKKVRAELTVNNPQDAVSVHLCSWTGNSDEFTKAIITGISNMTPQTEPNWSIIDTQQINENISGSSVFSHEFTVPGDAKNFAIVFTPSEEQQPVDIKVSHFSLNAAMPFTGYLIQAPMPHRELHLDNSKEFIHFGINTDGYATIRYTVNSTATKLPTGFKLSGDAHIDNIKAWSDSNFKGEGAISFNTQGRATINCKLYVYPGEKIPAQGSTSFTAYFSKKTGGNPGSETFQKIDDSQLPTVTLHHGDKPQFVNLPEFTIDVNPGDVIWLFGQAGIDDGAYIQSNSGSLYFVDINIDFDEYAAREIQMLQTINDLQTIVQKIDDEFIVTKDASDNGVYAKLDYDVGKKQPKISAEIK